MVKIFYNNQDPFSGIAPTPLVAQRNSFIKYGEQWGEVTHLSLNGTLTGQCASGNSNFFNTLIANQQQLVQNFSKDYQNLQIIQDGQTLVTKPYCIIKGINFSESTYASIIPFQIDIDCYESGFFSGYFGVLEPKNEFTFTQNQDQSITIQHSLSCQGFNTDSNNSNALQNAKNYLSAISGFNNQILPYFIKLGTGQYATDMSACLIEQKEDIDRVKGSYAINETYISDPYFSSGILRYSATYDSGINDGISNVKIAGSIKTSRNYPIDFVRSRYQTFDVFSAAVDTYSGATNGLIDLNPLYLSSGITEDTFGGILNFNVAFNNDQIPSPYIDLTVSFDHDIITDVTSAKASAVIRARGELSQRYQKVLAFSTGVDLYSLTQAEYVRNGYLYTLNPIFLSYGNTRNPYQAEITLSASYGDKMLPASGFANLDYSFSVIPSIRKYVAVPLLNGMSAYEVTDLNFVNRSVVTLQGAGTILQNIPIQSGQALLENFVNQQINPFIAGKNRPCLDSQSTNFGNSNIGRDFSFSTSFSFEDNELVI